MTLIQITDWNTLYENNRTRELKKLDWVPIPNRMDSDGYTELLDHPNGAAHLGVWLAILQIASRCDVRGTLSRRGARPHDTESLARISRMPAQLFAEAIPRLQEIGWLSTQVIEEPDDCTNPQEGAEIPRESADLRARVSLPFSAVPFDSVQGESAERGIDSSMGPILAELKEIYTAAGVPVAEGHWQLITQLLISIPAEKRKRVPNYCKWALCSGRWPDPSKTKSLLNVLRDGNWDVELTARLLPSPTPVRPPSRAEQSHDSATRKFLERK